MFQDLSEANLRTGEKSEAEPRNENFQLLRVFFTWSREKKFNCCFVHFSFRRKKMFFKICRKKWKKFRKMFLNLWKKYSLAFFGRLRNPETKFKMAKPKKSWTFKLFSLKNKWLYVSGLKGLLLGITVSLVLTSALLGSASGQRTQQQKPGPSYTTASSDEKIPTTQ